MYNVEQFLTLNINVIFPYLVTVRRHDIIRYNSVATPSRNNLEYKHKVQ